MAAEDKISELQMRLTSEVHAVWSALAVPEWKAPESEADGRGEPEHVEISRYLAGKTYEAVKDFSLSESVFIWCRADVATYYLGGYLLNAIERLSYPQKYFFDLHTDSLHSFLEVDSLYREVYRHILGSAPQVVSVVGRYGELLLRCHQGGLPEYWLENTPWPEELALIERIRGLWRDRGVFERAVDALPLLG